MTVSYEWDAIELSQGGDDADVVEHHHCDTLREAIEQLHRLNHGRIELVRDVGSEAQGITDRQWAWVRDGRLPVTFDGGARVPQRFHNECRRVWPGVKL